MKPSLKSLGPIVASVLCLFNLTAAPWQPAKGPLATRWSAEVNPENVLPDYPRPQLVRQQWLNLNGLWEFELTPRQAPQPASFNERILVPFPVESALSGLMLNGYTTDYEDFNLAQEAAATLKPGSNLIAIHCRQTAGGQYIDVGIVHLPALR